MKVPKKLKKVVLQKLLFLVFLVVAYYPPQQAPYKLPVHNILSNQAMSNKNTVFTEHHK